MPRNVYYRYWHLCNVHGKKYRLPIYQASSKAMNTKNALVTAANRQRAMGCVRKMKCLFMDSQRPPVGIAAPQLGYNLRLIGINYNQQFIFLHNPVIIGHGKAIKSSPEACLSDRDGSRKVQRYHTVLVKFQSLDSLTRNPQISIFQGLASFIIQHEINHLNCLPWWRSSI